MEKMPNGPKILETYCSTSLCISSHFSVLSSQAAIYPNPPTVADSGFEFGRDRLYEETKNQHHDTIK